MDDQIFQAMLGTSMPADNSEQSSAVAGALRGQHDLGQFLSIAPGLETAGQNMQKGALSQTKQIGDRRQQGLARTRQLERDTIGDAQSDRTYGLAKTKADRTQNRNTAQDELAAEALLHARQGYDDIESYTNAAGKNVLYGTNKSTGAFEEVPETAGLKPTQKRYGSDKWVKMSVPGDPTSAYQIQPSTGRIIGPEGKSYADAAAFKVDWADLAEQGRENAGQMNTAEQRGTDVAKEIQDRLDGHYETNSRLANTQNTLDNVLSSIAAGATSGNVADWFMTVDNATAQLESALSNLTLDSLTQYKLTPVSDKDLAYVRRGAAPNLTAEGLERWGTHKKEAVSRMQEANTYMEDWIDANQEVPRGAKRKMVEKEIDRILHADGFEFAFDLDAEEKRAPQFNKVDASSIPKILSDGGVTAADWAGYTDDQRKALMAD